MPQLSTEFARECSTGRVAAIMGAVAFSQYSRIPEIRLSGLDGSGVASSYTKQMHVRAATAP